MRFTHSIITALALLLASATAQAQGTITSGGATFDVTGFMGPNGWLVDLETSMGTDQQFSVGFWYRIGAATAESRLQTPTTESYMGDTMTLTYTNVGGSGVDVTIVGVLSSPAAGQADMTYTVTLANTTASAVSMTLFGYADYDLDGTIGNDSATLTSAPPAATITITDGTATTAATFSGTGVGGYDVATFPMIPNLLNDMMATTLTNGGLPFGPGDYTGVYSWSLSVPAMGSTMVTMSTGANEAGASLCGNGTVDMGETCDDGFTDACGTCNATCDGMGTGATCGDGMVCPELETCDDGFTDACGTCNATCDGMGTGSTCGDGMVCMETETCDDGFTDACGTCNATCDGMGTGSTCGDGMVCMETETCDDGFMDDCGTCNATCDGAGTGSTCGDGMICMETEMCDDGNTMDGDGCSMTCMTEADAGPMPGSDAGPMPGTDGGTMPGTDGGTMPGTDGGTMPGTDSGIAPGTDGGVGPGVDAGPMEEDGGCNCRAAGHPSGRPGGLIVGLGIIGLAWLRRRRR